MDTLDYELKYKDNSEVMALLEEIKELKSELKERLDIGSSLEEVESILYDIKKECKRFTQ